MRLPPRQDQGTNPAKLAWSTRKRPDSPVRDLDNLPGPRSVSFGGLRFRLDSKLQYISWMGWGMYFGFDRDMGLSLWDLRFKGERIIYEVSLTTFATALSNTLKLNSWHLKRQLRSTVRVQPYSSPYTRYILWDSRKRPNAK